MTKRLFDLTISILLIVTVLPLLIVIAIAVKVTSRGDVLYRGLRVGLNNKGFYIFKYRSMVLNAESKGGYSTAMDDQRLTKIGRILRRYKLDELPQLINVVRGEMSLVGPRPQVFYYTDKYKGDQKLILSVKPGITDFASLYFSDMDLILGQRNVDKKYEDEIEPIKNILRLRYVKERTFFLDIRILIETAFTIIGIKNVTRLDLSP